MTKTKSKFAVKMNTARINQKYKQKRYLGRRTQTKENKNTLRG